MPFSKNQKNIKVSPYDYAYATGRIRALENSLMNAAQISRLFDASTLEEVEKVLIDCGYKVSANLQESIINDLNESFLLIRSIVPDKSLVDIMMLENDYHNIKVILKSVIPHSRDLDLDKGLYEEEDDELIRDDDISDIIQEADRGITAESIKNNLAYPGLYTPDQLISLVFDESPDFSDTDIITLVRKALREYKKTQDAGAIDRVVDKMYFERLFSYSENLNDEIFTNYCGALMDSINLEILLRSRKMGFSSQVFENNLISGFEISVDVLKGLYDAGESEIKKVYSGTLCEKLSEFSDSYNRENTAVLYAKTADAILTGIMQKSRMVLFGPSIPLAYLYAKQLQAKNINIAITCKRNNLPKEIMYELVRNPF